MNFSFLISTERSGSNLITKMIDAHPNCCGPSPTHLFRIYALNIEKYGDLSNAKNWEILVQDTLEVLASQFGAWEHEFCLKELMNSSKEYLPVDLLKFIYSTEVLSNRKQQVFVKELYTYKYVPYILSEIPDAKFIYLVRDPRDTAASFKKSPSHQKSVAGSISIWQEDQRASIKVLEDLGKDKVLLVRYEDLVVFPEKTCTQITTFLGEQYSSEMLDFHQNTLTKQNASRMAAWKNLDKPIIAGNCNKYKGELSDSELLYIETKCKLEMDYFDYALETKADGDLEELSLKVDHPVPPIEVMPMTLEEKRVRERRTKAIQTIINRDIS